MSEVTSPGEEPFADGASDHHVLTGEDELGDPEQGKQVVPPEKLSNTNRSQR